MSNRNGSDHFQFFQFKFDNCIAFSRELLNLISAIRESWFSLIIVLVSIKPKLIDIQPLNFARSYSHVRRLRQSQNEEFGRFMFRLSGLGFKISQQAALSRLSEAGVWPNDEFHQVPGASSRVHEPQTTVEGFGLTVFLGLGWSRASPSSCWAFAFTWN